MAENGLAHFMCYYRVFQKTETLDYFDDNFGKYGLILTIFSLLQQEIHDAHKLRHRHRHPGRQTDRQTDRME